MKIITFVFQKYDTTMKRLFIITLATLSLTLPAQEKCGTQEYIKYMEETNTEYKIARKKVNFETRNWIKENSHHIKKSIITIPVIVHVLWETSIHNISDAQIQSQIDVLNEDYRRNNIDQINTPNVWNSIAADCEIEFCLAATDPNGQPTTGIERIQTTHGPFGMNSDIHTSSAGGADDWPNDDYLNIWVCDIQSGLLGYASSASNWISNGDGLVIGYKYFGTTGVVQPPYHKGRTATHEIGHWLNLEHVWGDTNCGDDQVNDTPTQEEENYGCPSMPHNANSCGSTNINGDMFMNYMDYTNDACMNLFTEGQKIRMISTLVQYRSNMLNHNLCSPPTEIIEQNSHNKKLIKIIDILGRESSPLDINRTLFYIYNDRSVEKKIIFK